MRLLCFAFIAAMAFPGLCLAQPTTPEITDDIANQPAVSQPVPVQEVLPGVVTDDSAEVIMPGTVRVVSEDNATFPAENATLPNVDVNATMPNIDVNATLPQYNATMPKTDVNATLPQVNATMPRVDVNATLPQYNATMPRVDVNATLPQYNATMPKVDVNATRPNVAVNATRPNVAVNATRPNVTVAPGTAPSAPLSVADFLVKAPEKKAEEPKTEPKKPEVKKPETKKPEAKKPEPQKAEPKKPEPQTTAQKKPTSGQAMKIPPNAAKTGDVSFLEGCWRGYRPEYHSKRMITERFCFDDSGVGKRTINDPAYAGDCYGATRALINKDGVLHMKSQEAICTSGETWGPSEMTCKGEGEQTPCYWNFTAYKGKASQSYKISFVRE